MRLSRKKKTPKQCQAPPQLLVKDIRIADEFITLARVSRTQGRHGEVAVKIHTDVPDRFKTGMALLALRNDGIQRELKVENLWPHKGMLVLKFAGVNSITEAEGLIGCELQIPRAQRPQLDSGWAYTSDLVGCAVFDESREIGTVNDVQFGAGEAPLLIVQAGTKQYEIPYAEAYLKKVDLDQKRIEMLLPEGILDLNAPLTAEEKLQQNRPRKQ